MSPVPSSVAGGGAGLGASLPRADAPAKTSGEATYAQDIRADAMLEALVVFTNQPHARIRSLDTSAAEALDGVVAVVTAADVAVNEYGLTMFDQPVLVGPVNTGRSAVAGDVSRWEADHLAIVIAESREIAVNAAGLIEAEWESLPVVGDIEAALAPDAPLVHPETPTSSNAYHHYVVRNGTPDELVRAFDEAHVVVEGVYDLPHQEHAFLQTEAGVAYVDDEGRITVETAGQWTHEDQEQIAHALDLPTERDQFIADILTHRFVGHQLDLVQFEIHNVISF